MIGKSALPLLFITCISTATALRCNETDALIQVKFNITQEQWDAEELGPSGFRTPFLQIPGDEAMYRRFSDLTDFEACLPRDDCSEVIVAGLPTDGYRISFDGVPVDIGSSFPFDGTNDTRAVDNGALKSYTVRQNGVLLGDSREVPDQLSRNWIMTTLGLGQNCFATENHSLSSGAIAGIIIACCVVLSILIGLIMVCMVRSEERKNEPDEEDPLNENLLTGESYIVYS
jgi:hypothetical protein